MNIDAVALVDILKSEKEAYQELLDLAQEEQGLIVEGNVDGISGVVRATERLMLIVSDLENKRLDLLQIGSDLDLPQQAVELSSVMKTFDAPMTNEAQLLKDEILSITKALSQTNQTNAGLLKRKINYVDFMLGVLFPADKLTYRNKPNPQGSCYKLFDGRA